jgi:2-dehydro-3-deoxyphosphogluconate aldolase / (4S)-4-hydroxy-2-oxoglutarate aldolase
MHDILRHIGDLGIVPVVVIDDAALARPLCRALIEGGLPIAEITFRTAAAEAAIRTVAQELPEVLVGAGTVLTTEQAARAAAAGAKFIVSPGFNPAVVDYCLEMDLPITPGCSSPTDVGLAAEKGLEVVKFFPAEAAGGVKALKAIAAPFGGMRFIPTGGIEAANLNDYLSFNKVLACGGSWMVKADLIKAGRFDEITRLTREAIAVMLDFRIVKVALPKSINAPEAARLAAALNDASRSVVITEADWTGLDIPLLALETRSIPRAMAYLKRRGLAVDIATAMQSKDGNITSIRLLDTFNTSAVQLVQRA